MTKRTIAAALNEKDVASHLIRTRYGIEFDAREGWWPIDGKNGVDVSVARSLVGPQLSAGLEATLRDCATRYAPSTLHLFVQSLRNFSNLMCEGQRVDAWDLTVFRNYRVVLMNEYGHEDYLRHIRSLLVRWDKGRWPGIPASLVTSLKEMKLKGAETGRAVRVMDPEEGPLTPDELDSLMQNLNDAAEGGHLSLSDFSLAYLHILSGRRPIQTAYLKCKDVVQRVGEPDDTFPQGRPLYLIAIPRAKQKGHTFRETRRAIDLTPSNFELFRCQRESVQEQFQRRLESQGWSLQPQDLDYLLAELPLYPCWSSIQIALQDATSDRDAGNHARALERLRTDAMGNAWHRSPDQQKSWVKRVCESVGTQSRAGSPLKVNAVRLRRTKGTELARQGLSSHLIAWVLDQLTSRSAEIYVDNLAEHAAQINGGIAKSPTMQRYASAFRGRVVDSESDAIGGDVPGRSRIAVQGKDAATCGGLKQCGMDEGIPRACYRCSHFQPWLDGPHEELLAVLMTERADAVSALGADSPIAKRRDILIDAVKDVIARCRRRRAELASNAATESVA